MAANTFASGTSGTTVVFDRPINILNISVFTGTTFQFSIDKGENFMTLPEGFSTFRIGPVSEIQIIANATWELIGVQA